MGFSTTRMSGRDERPWKIHPVWRGIGCVLIIMIPILSYAGAVMVMNSNPWIHLFPSSLFRPVVIRYVNVSLIDSVIGAINTILAGFGLIYGHVFFLLVFIFIGFGVLSILYGFLYRAMGPPRYSRLDAPPIKKRKRRY